MSSQIRRGRPRKRIINTVEEIPSCPIPVKTYVRKKTVIDPLACTPHHDEGIRGYETVNGTRASETDLNNQEMTQDLGLEVQYILPQSPSNVQNDALVAKCIIPYMDLENGEMILETAQQESSDRNLPLMLDPTVLESRGLDPKLSQVGNLIQNQNDDLEEEPSLLPPPALVSFGNSPMWKMLPQSDTRKKNENQSKSSTSTTPLLNQDSQKVDEDCASTSVTCSPIPVPRRSGSFISSTNEKPEIKQPAKECNSTTSPTVLQPSQLIPGKIIEAMRNSPWIDTSTPVANGSTGVTSTPAQMKSTPLQVFAKDNRSDQTQAVVVNQMKEMMAKPFQVGVKKTYIASRRIRPSGTKPDQSTNPLPVLLEQTPSTSPFANGKTIVTYSPKKKTRDPPEVASTSNSESPREPTVSIVQATTKCTKCCEKDNIIAQLNAKLKFYEEISQLQQYSAGLRSISSTVEQISKNLEPLKRISSSPSSDSDQSQREPLVELFVHDAVVKEEPYDGPFIYSFENPLFPITEEFLSRIPSTFRVNVPTFVTKLLSMLYEPDYFNTHKLPGQVNIPNDRFEMDEAELQNIIETVMNCKLDPPSNGRPVTECQVRSAIARMFAIGSK